MKSCASITLLVFLLVNQSFAKESCKTCRGSDCFEENALYLDCTKFVPALPFESQLLINNNVGDLKYGCLNLEYYIDETLDHIQQCILTTDLLSFCNTLEYSLKIKQCSVDSTSSPRHARDLSKIEASIDELQSFKKVLDGEAEPETDDGSGDTDETDDPNDIPTTTPSHASTVHFISLMSFLGIFLVIIL